jgi:Tfp pilus assembly pilus retraction ATPase PilT
MNAITPITPEGAHLWGHEHRMIRGEMWNDLFVWGHRQGMSDLHLQTNHRVMIDVHGRLHPATKRTITAEEMTSAVALLYGVTGPAHLKKAESFDLAHVVEPKEGKRYSVGGPS